MRRLRPTSLRRVDLPGKSLLFGPLSFEHVLCGFPRRVELSLRLSFHNSLQRLGVGALALRREILRSSFELFGRAILNEMTADPAFLAHITGRRVSKTRNPQTDRRAVLDVVARDAAPPTNIVSWGYPSSLLTRHGTHLGRRQSRTVGVPRVVVRVHTKSV